MIAFNIPYISNTELQHISQAIQKRDLAGDGFYAKKVQDTLKDITDCKQVLLTSSCTHALEMCAILCNLKEGDEVIMPSFSFVSTANAVVLQGAKPVFVDIRPDTMNIDEQLIEMAISPKTKAIMVMHYGGLSCEMDYIMQLANKHGLIVIEDAAHCIGAHYKNKHLGTIGHLGAISFHSTKNVHCGEGGALLINDKKLEERAFILREKGTNRVAFIKGEVEKYSWMDMGSSYLMSELAAAFLYEQLQHLSLVNDKRKQLWDFYARQFQQLKFPFPVSSKDCKHNAHIFYIKLKNQEERKKCIAFLKTRGIASAFHYVPLHSSEAGKKYGQFWGLDKFTTSESERLLRLPIYFDLETSQVQYIFESLRIFLKNY